MTRTRTRIDFEKFINESSIEDLMNAGFRDWEINKDLTMSVVLALAFYLTQQYIFQQESFDQIKNLEKFQNRYYLNKEKANKSQ